MFWPQKERKGNDMRWKMCELTLLRKFFYSILCCCYLVAQSCLTLWRPHGLLPIRLLCPWDFPGKNTGVGCHFLLQGTFLTQGLNTQTHVSCIGRKILYGWATREAPQRYTRLTHFITSEVDFDHVFKVVSVKFLQCRFKVQLCN